MLSLYWLVFLLWDWWWLWCLFFSFALIVNVQRSLRYSKKGNFTKNLFSKLPNYQYNHHKHFESNLQFFISFISSAFFWTFYIFSGTTDSLVCVHFVFLEIVQKLFLLNSAQESLIRDAGRSLLSSGSSIKLKCIFNIIKHLSTLGDSFITESCLKSVYWQSTCSVPAAFLQYLLLVKCDIWTWVRSASCHRGR